MKKTLLAFLCALFLTAGWANAQIVVRIGPPAPIVERRPPPPREGYVWVQGYHRWDGQRYVWVPGEWRQPPRPHAHWVDGRWEHRHDGYVWVEGRWR